MRSSSGRAVPDVKAELIGGPFSDFTRGARDTQARAVTIAVRAATNGMKVGVRGGIIRAGLGTRLANAVGSKVYPANGASLSAAGLVFPRGPLAERILGAFAEGVSIAAKGKRFLAIPTRHAGRAGRGRRPSPEEIRSQGVKLRLVPARTPGHFLLMGDLPSRTRKDRSVVFFVLVPLVRLRKRLDGAALARRWSDAVPDLIERAMPDG